MSKFIGTKGIEDHFRLNDGTVVTFPIEQQMSAQEVSELYDE
jgi:hypothetical protein